MSLFGRGRSRDHNCVIEAPWWRTRGSVMVSSILIHSVSCPEADVRRPYRIAARHLAWDPSVPALVAFRTQGDAVPRRWPPAGYISRPAGSILVYQGPGWIGDHWRDVACWSNPAGCWLSVADSGEFYVAADGSTIAEVETAPGANTSLVVETVLGPALILALALQGVWCLHAGAIAAGGKAVVFLGESGSGKSTLAAFLGLEGGRPWKGLCDDVLPVERTAHALEALPHFPQLKLQPEKQPSVGMPERMPVRAVYQLETPDSEHDTVDIRPLGGQEAALTLVRHTLAARLFDKRLLAQHLSFCAEAAARVPVRRLSYPRRHEVLPLVREAILDDLQRVGQAAGR
jgi:hypothetical protein